MQSTHRYGSAFNQECEESIDRLDAVNKAYADRIKYKTASGNIPNTVFTDLTSHYPLGKLLPVKR